MVQPVRRRSHPAQPQRPYCILEFLTSPFYDDARCVRQENVGGTDAAVEFRLNRSDHERLPWEML